MKCEEELSCGWVIGDAGGLRAFFPETQEVRAKLVSLRLYFYTVETLLCLGCCSAYWLWQKGLSSSTHVSPPADYPLFEHLHGRGWVVMEHTQFGCIFALYDKVMSSAP